MEPKFADRVREFCTAVGSDDITLQGAAPGHAAWLDALPEGPVYYCLESIDGSWEIGVGTLSDSGITRDTVISSSAGDSAIAFGAVRQQAYSCWPAARALQAQISGEPVTLPAGSSDVSPLTVTPAALRTTPVANTLEFFGGHIYFTDAGVTRWRLLMEDTTVAAPPGDQWIAGAGLYQDEAATVPAAEGDNVRAWKTASGRLLLVAGSPMVAVMVDGELCPAVGPTAESRFVSAFNVALGAVDVHIVLTQTAGSQFSIGTEERKLELQGFNGGIVTYNGATVTNNAQQFATRVVKTQLGVASDAVNMTPYRDGLPITPAGAPASGSDRPVVIGNLDQDVSFAPAYAVAYFRIAILNAPSGGERSAVLADLQEVATLPARPWLITYTDSQGVVRAGPGIDGWHPTDGLNRRLCATHNVVGISRSGGVIADLNTTGMANAVALELGTIAAQTAIDGTVMSGARRLIFFVTNDLQAGNAASYEAAITARADQYVTDGIFTAGQIVMVIPPYRYSPWDAAVYNAQVDILAGLLASSDYGVVDLRSVVIGGGIHTDGVHMTASGVDAAEAAIRGLL